MSIEQENGFTDNLHQTGSPVESLRP
jgi:hypothetical protein